MPSNNNIVVAGLGNLLLHDDGVGVHAAYELLQSPLEGAEVLDIGTAVLHALSFLKPGSRVLAIDALQNGGAPGDLYLLDGRSAVQPGERNTIHAWGLNAALRLMPNGGADVEIIVLGIEPARLDPGMELSPAVAAALPRIVALTRAVVTRWRWSRLPVGAFLWQAEWTGVYRPAERRMAS